MTQRPHVEGVRVLRGRDWEEGEADGGEGHLGTVQASPGNGVVRVLWDIGQESTCRAGQGNKFDLRVFDTGTVGQYLQIVFSPIACRVVVISSSSSSRLLYLLCRPGFRAEFRLSPAYVL